MRELLFKGFHADENGKEKIFINGEWVKGQWVEGYYVNDLARKEYIIMAIYDAYFDAKSYKDIEPYKVIPETVSQFTGLTDKNGVKIFENDVVSCEDGDGGYEHQDLCYHNGTIAYGNYGFYITDRQSITLRDMYIDNNTCNEIEVVGNIFDNPELLEV